MPASLPLMLSVTEEMYELLRSTLLTACGREQQLFALLTRSGTRLLVQRVFVLSAGDYQERSPFSVAWAPSVRMQVRLSLEEDRPDAVLDLHSHPFSHQAKFSSIDAAEHARRFFDFQESDPECLFVRGVFGQDEDGFTLETFPDPSSRDFEYLADGSGHLIPEIEVFGKDGVRRIRSFRAPQLPMPKTAVSERFQRNAVLRTKEENLRISNAHVAVVGAGGAGAALALLITLTGVGRLSVVDPDDLGPENFNRLDWARPVDVGRPKVARLGEHLREHDPDLSFTGIIDRFPSAAAMEAMEAADIVLVGVDDDRVRYDVLRWCVRHQRPALDVGTGISLDAPGGLEVERAGHVWVYMPGRHRCWMHMGLDTPLLWDEALRAARKAAGYVVDAPSTASPGSVQALNTLVASIAVIQAEQLLLGRPVGADMTHVRFGLDGALSFEVVPLSVHAEVDCPLCGADGFEGVGGDPFTTFSAAATIVCLPPDSSEFPKVGASPASPSVAGSPETASVS